VFNLSNLKVDFLHPNVTSKAQPLDQGIIAAYKAHFRHFLVAWLVEAANKPGNEDKLQKDLVPSIYQAMHWLLQAWKDKVTAETIKNCWRKSGLLPEAALNAATAVAPQVQESAETAELDASADDAEVAAADQESMLDSAMQQLEDAIAQLQALAVRRNLLPEGQELASAEEFLELEGEGEVFEELADETIVALVQSQGVDEPESDEDEQDDPEVCKVTLQQAVACAEQLESFAFSHPELFCAEQMLSLGNIRRDLHKKRVSGMQQQTLAGLWAGR
jgi:hypothetical protein